VYSTNYLLLASSSGDNRFYLIFALWFLSSVFAGWNEASKTRRSAVEQGIAWAIIFMVAAGSLVGAFWTKQAQDETQDRIANVNQNLVEVAHKRGAHLLDGRTQQERIGKTMIPYSSLRIAVQSDVGSLVFCNNLKTALTMFGSFPRGNIVDRCGTPSGAFGLDVVPSPVNHQIVVNAAEIDGNGAAAALVALLNREGFDTGFALPTPSPQEQERREEATRGLPDRRSVEVMIYAP